MNRIRLATLDDPLCTARTERVRDRLKCLPDPPGVETAAFGPARRDADGADLLFEKLQEAEIDVAVCPGASLPLRLPEGVDVAAVVRDHEPECWCASRYRPVLSLLPTGSKVITCHPAVRAQILHRYPWLWAEVASPGEEVAAGLSHGLWDAGCVPAEILECASGKALHGEPIAPVTLLPPAGQGVAALVSRRSDGTTRALVRRIDAPRLAVRWRTERLFVLSASEGIDGVFAAHAVLTGETMDLIGFIADPDGSWLSLDQASAPIRFSEALAQDLAESCRHAARTSQLSPVLTAHASRS